MTDSQKKLEQMLLEHIENEVSAVKETNNVPEAALVLIELWKISSENQTF